MSNGNSAWSAAESLPHNLRVLARALRGTRWGPGLGGAERTLDHFLRQHAHPASLGFEAGLKLLRLDEARRLDCDGLPTLVPKWGLQKSLARMFQQLSHREWIPARAHLVDLKRVALRARLRQLRQRGD